jgi:hypothetical protein
MAQQQKPRKLGKLNRNDLEVDAEEKREGKLSSGGILEGYISFAHQQRQTTRDSTHTDTWVVHAAAQPLGCGLAGCIAARGHGTEVWRGSWSRGACTEIGSALGAGRDLPERGPEVPARINSGARYFPPPEKTKWVAGLGRSHHRAGLSLPPPPSLQPPSTPFSDSTFQSPLLRGPPLVAHPLILLPAADFLCKRQRHPPAAIFKTPHQAPCRLAPLSSPGLPPHRSPACWEGGRALASSHWPLPPTSHPPSRRLPDPANSLPNFPHGWGDPL